MARERRSARHTAARALSRLHVRGVLQTTGVLSEATTSLHTDRREVAELLDDRRFRSRLDAMADTQGKGSEEATAEAASYLREMAATHSDRTGAAFRRFGQWMARAYDVYVDDES